MTLLIRKPIHYLHAALVVDKGINFGYAENEFLNYGIVVSYGYNREMKQEMLNQIWAMESDLVKKIMKG